MWLNIKRGLLILLVAISFLGIAGCEAKPQINKPAMVEVMLIGDHPKTITGAYLFRFERKAEPGKAEPEKAEPGKAEPGKAEPGKAEDAKRMDTFNLGKNVKNLLLKDWKVQTPPELKIEKKEAKVSLVEGGAYELKPILTIAATPEAASRDFQRSIAVEFPSIVEIAKFLEANIPCPPKGGSRPDRSPQAISTPINTPTEGASPTPTEGASPTPTPTESASPTPTPTESASPIPTTTAEASPSPSSTNTEGVVNNNPDRIPKETNVPACVPKVEFQVTHYASYSQLGFDNIGMNFLGMVGCALFVALMVWFLSDKWDILFEQILYILAAVSLYVVGLVGIPFFFFHTLKNIGWILGGLFQG